MGLYIQHNDIKFKVGDTVRVYQKIVESGKERIQVFEGLVIGVSGHQGEKMFTVRKISSGVGVERVWPVDSPFIQKVEVMNNGIPSRAKLNYLRNRTGRLALKVKTKYATKNNRIADVKEPENATAEITQEKPEAIESSTQENTGNAGGTENQETAAK